MEARSELDYRQRPLFAPATFSTDWEITVLDRLERPVSNERCVGFAGVLERELGLPITTDMCGLEFGLGVNRTLAEISDRIRTATDRAQQLLREYGLELLPLGSHPVAPHFNASHIHVGTLRDERRAIELEGPLMRWVPAFAALAANSPASAGRVGGCKSYRVRERADGCTEPASLRDPGLAQATWGADAAPKLYGVPTLEVRVTDCASSRRFLAELSTLVAAWVHHLGERPGAPLTVGEYREALVNRWAAARHGMQATFRWRGRDRPAAEVLEEMLDTCREELRALGARRRDLGLIELAVRKRTCQADLVLELSRRYPDPYCLASAAMKLLRHWDVFDGYLESCAPLDPLPAPDEEAVLREHLEGIGEGVHFYRTREVMSFPPPAADEVLEELIRRGAVRSEVSPTRGFVLTRTGD